MYGKDTYRAFMDFSYEVTGFQSACAEFAQKRLSLDERYLTNRPATFIVEVASDAAHLSLRARDKLIIDRSLRPSEGVLALLVINNQFVLNFFSRKMLVNQDEETGDFLWGVVTTLIREFK